jgi:hypothetical protein
VGTSYLQTNAARGKYHRNQVAVVPVSTELPDWIFVPDVAFPAAGLHAMDCTEGRLPESMTMYYAIADICGRQ